MRPAIGSFPSSLGQSNQQDGTYTDHHKKEKEAPVEDIINFGPEKKLTECPLSIKTDNSIGVLGIEGHSIIHCTTAANR